MVAGAEIISTSIPPQPSISYEIKKVDPNRGCVVLEVGDCTQVDRGKYDGGN